MSTERWLNFWQKFGLENDGKDDQSQVLRTFNKQPIADDCVQGVCGYVGDGGARGCGFAHGGIFAGGGTGG